MSVNVDEEQQHAPDPDPKPTLRPQSNPLMQVSESRDDNFAWQEWKGRAQDSPEGGERLGRSRIRKMTGK